MAVAAAEAARRGGSGIAVQLSVARRVRLDQDPGFSAASSVSTVGGRYVQVTSVNVVSSRDSLIDVPNISDGRSRERTGHVDTCHLFIDFTCCDIVIFPTGQAVSKPAKR